MRGNLFGGLMGIVLTSILFATAPHALADQESVAVPAVFLQGIPYDLTFSVAAYSDTSVSTNSPTLVMNDRTYQGERRDDAWVFLGVTAQDTGTAELNLIINDTATTTITAPVIPGWISILPPLLAIGMALLLRSVLPALMFGLWLGAWALQGMSLEGVFYGLLASF